jgi:hypothetical protein
LARLGLAAESPVRSRAAAPAAPLRLRAAEAMLDPRVILQALLDRLEPEVGTISRAQLRRESASGVMPAWLGHLATSALMAREALMSGEQKQMAGAAALCPQHERIGRRLQQRHTATIMRHAGGKRRGNQQTRDAGVVWEPYLQMAQNSSSQMPIEKRRADL